MLKLILETGYVDPEILEQLSEEQREVTILTLNQQTTVVILKMVHIYIYIYIRYIYAHRCCSKSSEMTK